MLTFYLLGALLFAVLVLVGVLRENEPHRSVPAFAYFVAILLACLAWPILVGIVLRGYLLAWRDRAVVLWRNRNKARG